MSEKKRQDNRHRFDGKYISLRNTIIGFHNIYEGMSMFKNHMLDNDVGKYIHKLNNDKLYKKYISGSAYPKKLEDLGNSRALRCNTDLSKELFWSAHVLRLHSNKINDFLSEQNKYYSYLLLGEYENASNILDKIEIQFGYSLWLLQNKISLLDIMKGLEAQKNYTNTIIENESVANIVKFLCSYYSIKAERNISYTKFNSIVQDSISESQKQIIPELWNYVNFELNCFEKNDRYDNLSVILYYSNRYSIIDRYLTFVKICKYVYSNYGLKKSYNYLKNAIELLVNKFSNDRSINNLAIALGLKNIESDGETALFVNLCDELLSSNYKKCETESFAKLSKCPLSLEYYFIYVISISKQHKDITMKTNMQSTILHCIYNLLNLNGDSNESRHKILKISLLYQDTNWSLVLLSFLHYSFLYDDFKSKAIIQFGILSSNTYSLLAAFYSNKVSSTRKVLKDLNLLYANNSIIKLLDAISNRNIASLNKIKLSPQLVQICKADIYKAEGKVSEAIKIYKSLLECKYESIHHVTNNLLNCYIIKHDFEDGVNFAVDSFIKNENMIFSMPIYPLIEQVDDGQLDSVNSISIPILCDLYSRYISNDKDYCKSITYEDFLICNGINKPTDLFKIRTNFDNYKYIYFLSNICIIPVMEKSIYFNNSEEVLKERILICQQLITLDPMNKTIYSNEIIEITGTLLINSRMRDIDNSKIYVDVEGIKKAAEKNMRESYTRYLSFNANDKNVKRTYIKVGEDESNGIEIMIPNNERDGIFTAMFFELRDMFITSKYGLDSYLSVGIRHGTLAGQLRSHFEAFHLVTQKDNNTGIYHENEYWKAEFSNLSEDERSDILSLLSDFSKGVDDLIDLLKNKWIQIKTESKNKEGLFNFQMQLSELESIQSLIKPDTKYEEFIDIVIQKLWEKTENSLYIIRRQISYDLKDKFNYIFDKLQKELENYKHIINLAKINSCINNSRTSIQYELDNIANWFKKVNTSEPEDYDIDLPINIAAEMIKNIYPSNTLKNILSISDKITLKGWTLKHFVDIFYILFDNIIKHSHQKANDNVSINIQQDVSIINVTIENSISNQVNIAEISSKLLNIKKTIDTDLLEDNVRKEGGTGLIKICKIFNIDLKCKNEISFNIKENFTFIVNLKFDAKELKR